MSSDTINKIRDFEKKSWAIKVYATERWGDRIPCPIRLSVNPYFSCAHKCLYCYVWSNKKKIDVRKGFRKALIHDIKRGLEYGVNSFVAEISPSTDPFQGIEEKARESLFAIKELLKNGFKVLIVTKNPRLLLKDDYKKLLEQENLFIDVTITSLLENSKQRIILNNTGASALEKIAMIKEIISRGKDVRARIDPVVPTHNKFIGQTATELIDLTEKLAEIGVKLIITKTMRLSRGMPKIVVDNYLDYYKENGALYGSIYVLAKEIRRALLAPILETCKKVKVNFCPCCDNDVFEDEKTSRCLVDAETNLLSRDV